MTVTKFSTTPHSLVAECYMLEDGEKKLLCARMVGDHSHPQWREYPWWDHSWRYVGDWSLIRIAELLFAPILYDPLEPKGFKESREVFESASQNNIGTHC